MGDVIRPLVISAYVLVKEVNSLGHGEDTDEIAIIVLDHADVPVAIQLLKDDAIRLGRMLLTEFGPFEPFAPDEQKHHSVHQRRERGKS